MLLAVLTLPALGGAFEPSHKAFVEVEVTGAKVARGKSAFGANDEWMQRAKPPLHREERVVPSGPLIGTNVPSTKEGLVEAALVETSEHGPNEVPSTKEGLVEAALVETSEHAPLGHGHPGIEAPAAAAQPTAEELARSRIAQLKTAGKDQKITFTQAVDAVWTPRAGNGKFYKADFHPMISGDQDVQDTMPDGKTKETAVCLLCPLSGAGKSFSAGTTAVIKKFTDQIFVKKWATSTQSSGEPYQAKFMVVDLLDANGEVDTTDDGGPYFFQYDRLYSAHFKLWNSIAIANTK